MIPPHLRAALHELVDYLADDRDTVGELAGALERVHDDHDDRLHGVDRCLAHERRRRHTADAELRDDLHELAVRVEAIERDLGIGLAGAA